GRYHAGLATLTPVLREAASLNYPPLVAEAALRHGSLQMEAGDSAAADAAFSEALYTAIAVNDARTAAQAISKRMFLRTDRRGQPAEALRDVLLAQALHTRVRDDIDLYAEYLNNLAIVVNDAGDHARCRELLLEAVALRTEHGQADTVLNAYTFNNLGILEM